MDHPKLYSKDRKGNLRHWWIETTSDGQWRTHAGQIDGELVTSGWKQISIKNVGKANETSLEEQIQKEVDASYEKRTYGGHYAYEIEHLQLPKPFFDPMLAETFTLETDISYPVLMQPKLDGIRCLARVDGLWSRNGKPIVSAQHIFDAYEPVFEKYPDIVIDGELYNHQLRHEFEQLVSIIRKSNIDHESAEKSKKFLQHWIYDCYLPSQPEMKFSERHALLQEIVSLLKPQDTTAKSDDDFFESVEVVSDFDNQFPVVVVSTESTNDEGSVFGWLKYWMDLGYEGAMIRIPDSEYEPKRRSAHLLKVKDFQDEEVEIVEVRPGKGNWAGKAKSIEILSRSGVQQSSGMRGDEAFARMILEKAEELKGTVATVRFQGKLKSGKMRFPVVTKFWEVKERDL